MINVIATGLESVEAYFLSLDEDADGGVVIRVADRDFNVMINGYASRLGGQNNSYRLRFRRNQIKLRFEYSKLSVVI